MRVHKNRKNRAVKIGGILRAMTVTAGMLLLTMWDCFGQTPTSIQIPYAGTAVGIPAGSALVVCSAEIATTVGKEGDNCVPTQAVLKTPQSVVIDPKTGNIYIADQGNKQIREVYESGAVALQEIVSGGYNNLKVVTTSSVVAGRIYNACGPYSGAFTSISAAGGSCSNTSMAPVGLAIDPGGNIVDAEGTSRMRMVYTGGSQGAALLQATLGAIGKVTPAVGNEYPLVNGASGAPSGYFGDGANATIALMNGTKGIFIDANENIYIADSKSNAIRMINGVTGIITTIAGSSPNPSPGSTCVLATGVTYAAPAPGYSQGLPASVATLGGCTAGGTGDGGPALAAELNTPYDVVLDPSGNLYIADSGNGRVRVIYNGKGKIPGVSNPQLGYIYTVVGGGTLTVGGAATQLLLKSATGLGFDAAGNLYVADGTGGKIWEVDAATQVGTIIAGGGTASTVGAPCLTTFAAGPTKATAAGDGCLATLATLGFPNGRISFDALGNLYVADSTANIVREISRQVPAAALTAVGGTSGVALAFSPLSAVTVGGANFGVQGASSFDFSDAGGSTCNSSQLPLAAGQICYLNILFKPSLPGLRLGGAQVITSSGKILGTNYLSGIASGSAIALDSAAVTAVGKGLTPQGVTSDPSGAVYVSDKTSGSVLRYSSPTATVPVAIITNLLSPAQVSVDGEGNVLVADSGNGRIAVYNASTAVVSYLTGYSSPQGVVVDGPGNIFISDTGNNRVMQIQPGGAPTVVASDVSSPTQLSLDGNGNLYIVDSGNSRVVEIAGGNGAETVIALGLFNPAAIGIDAANDFYVLDRSGLQVGFISAQGAVTTTLVSGLAAPTGLYVDNTGDVYIADAQKGVSFLNRQQIAINYFPLNIGQVSTFSSFVLTNIGNAPLQFSGSAPFSGSGDVLDFQVSSSTTDGCSNLPMGAGTGCSLSGTFAPVALGSFREKLTFPSNAGNAGTASVILTGTGVNLANSNLTISSSPSAANPISFGSPITLTFTLSQSGTVAAAGQIYLLVNGIQNTVLQVVNGSATYTFSPQAGTFVIAGQYTGDTNYSSSHASLMLTVVPATTSTSLSYSGQPLSVQGNQVPAYVLTATVKSPGAGLVGVVSFSAGTTVLGIASLNGSGVATLEPAYTAANYLALSNPTFTATYIGGANFTTSTSNAVTVKGDMGLQPLATTLSEPQGAVAFTTVNVTPYLGLSGSVSFSCSNLPANSVCRFLTSTNNVLTFSGNSVTDQVGTVQFQIYTNVPADLAGLRVPETHRNATLVMEAGFGLFGVIGLVMWRRTRSRSSRLFGATIVGWVTLVISLGVIGCGSGNYYNYPNVTTPIGTTVVKLIATSSNGTVESIPVTMIVGPPAN
jgi:sugar lactone lactonase YvrE